MTSSNSSDQYIVKSKLAPFEYPNISMGEYLAKTVTKHDPNRIAFIDPVTGSEMTYGEFHRAAQQFAYTLVHKFGVVKQDLVHFFSDNSVQYAVALAACIYLGLTFVPVPPAHGPFELYEQIRQCSGRVLVIGPNKLGVVQKMLDNKEYLPSIEQLKLIVQLEVKSLNSVLLEHDHTHQIAYTFDQILQSGSGALLSCIPHFQIEDPSREPFFICFTSGTTGKPKGAILTHRSYVATLTNMKLPAEFHHKVTGITYPLGHISGTLFMQYALECGMTVIMFACTDIDTVVSQLAQYRVNHFMFAANAVTPLAQNSYPTQYDLSSLEVFRYGGCKFPAKLLETIRAKYGVRMYEIYGATEFMGQVTTTAERELGWERFEPGNLGSLAPNIEMKIVDLQSGQSLQANAHGEICFRGAPSFVGYLNNEEATQSTLDADGWYHSGDIGYYNESEHLFVTDRIKEMIKYKMWSVIPAEIEDFLHRHQAVWAVCVVGVPHATDGHLVRAYVQLAKGKEVTEQELIQYVQDNLGFQKRLRGGVKFISEMPRTTIGKIDRQYFKKLVQHELITDEIE